MTDLAPKRPVPLEGSYAAAEAIASRDRNNLYLTSCFFQEPAKYKAFCVFYALMRVVDDRVDGLLDRVALSERDRCREREVVSAWDEAVTEALLGRTATRAVVRECDHPHAADLLDAFADSATVFRTPPALWTDFFRSMQWDLDHDRFDTWQQFLTYAQGASVTPTTIYLRLLASRSDPSTGAFSLPQGLPIAKCGRQLGTFAYLAHIVRDLAEDLQTGARGRLYVTSEDMILHGVTYGGLTRDLKKKRASRATRALVADLLGRARHHLGEGRTTAAALQEKLEKDCAFILELIITMYERVILKIEACGHDPLAGRHRLTAAEKQGVALDVARRLALPGAPSHRSGTVVA